MSRKKLLITGSCGFLLGNFLRKLIYEKQPYQIISVDRFNYQTHNSMYFHKNHTFHVADITDQHVMDTIFQLEQPDIIIHGAAETSIDNSFNNPNLFIDTNILGTQTVLNAAVKHKVEKFIYLSSDDVYGPIMDTNILCAENAHNNPTNPYAVSKLSGELLVQTYTKAHQMAYNIVRCSSNYGPRQTPSKLIPKAIKSILKGSNITLYGTGSHIRDWTHVFDTCSALLTILDKGADNEIYNVSSHHEYTNLEVVQHVCNAMELGHNLITFIPDPRKSNDYRHASDSTKLRLLGWKPNFKFKDGINASVEWFKLNQWFLN